VTTQAPELVPVSPDAGYAPEFAVTVEGQPVDDSTKNDVVSIRVVRDLNNISGFDLTFNNWDDQALRFKYSEAESDQEPFALGRRVDVRLGYADKLVSVMTGQVTSLRPSFPESGSPTIGISGSDGMQKLKQRKPRDNEVKLYEDKADSEIAEAIAARNKLDRGGIRKTTEVHPVVWQKNQDDAAFLMERAKRNDFECYVLTDPNTHRDVLHFEPPTDGRDGPAVRAYQLAYGPGLAAEEERARAGDGGATPMVPNLLDFTPTLTAAEQVSRITVRGWNPRTKQPIAYAATVSDLPKASGRGVSGPEAATTALGGREEVVVDAPVSSDQEARELATSLLRERAYTFITGTGRIAGLPELRPGDNLEIHGIGRRFSGMYFVTKVQHTLGGSGFFTQFHVRRIRDGGPA
jgi:Bacteriophage probable baseplate hub protein